MIQIHLLPLLILLSPHVSGSDVCDMFVQEQCPFLPGNVVGTVSGLESEQLCQKECQAVSSCNNFTFFTFPDPDPNECYLFKSCEETSPCDDCVSGPNTPDMPDECMVDCGQFQNGRCDLLFDNMLDIVEPVTSSQECQEACSTTTSCIEFSYDRASEICFLFSACVTIDSCSTCISGPPFPDVTSCDVTPPSPTTMPGGTRAVTVGGRSRRDNLDYWLGSTEIFSLDETCPLHIWEMDDWSEMMVEYIDGKVMACGGYDRTKVGNSNKCWALDLNTGEWNLLKGLLWHATRLSGSVKFQSTMMLFGGFETTARQYVQEYVVKNDTWQYRSDLKMPEGKYGHCVVNVDDELIFVFGGDTSTSLSLDSAHVLNYTSGKWLELPSMHDARQMHTCLLWNMDGQRGIMVVGGLCAGANCDVVGPLRSVEFFDFEKTRWETLYDSFLQEPRYSHGMSVLDGVPLVYGGFRNATEILSNGERLDGGTWTKMEDVLVSARGDFGYTDIPADIIDC